MIWVILRSGIWARVLNEICPTGFKHNEQSLRVVDVLEGGGGLNLTYEVRDGIVAPHRSKKERTHWKGVLLRSLIKSPM